MNDLVEINKKSLEIRYDFKALIELERVSGKSMQQFFAEDITGDNVKLSAVCMFFFAGVKFGGVIKTLDEMIDLLNDALNNGQTLESIMKPFTQAIERSSFVNSVNEESAETEKGVQEKKQ